jgi:hypothetical protein
MRIYLASNWDSHARMRALRLEIQACGHDVIATWVDEDASWGFLMLSDAEKVMYAHRDLGEVCTADLVILDTLEASSSGGREIEAGFALGKKPLWQVGPARNIFHTVATRRFPAWEPALAALRALP